MVGVFLVAVVALTPAPPAGGGTVMLRAVAPDSVVAYEPVTLTLQGEGFATGCRVLMGAPGKLVPVPADVRSAETIEVKLALGVAPSPPRREVVVDCGAGRRSAPVFFVVVRRQAVPTPPPLATGAPAAAVEPVVGTREAQPAAPPPVVAKLDPAGDADDYRRGVRRRSPGQDPRQSKRRNVDEAGVRDARVPSRAAV